MIECSHKNKETIKSKELTEKLCPTGFRFYTNIGWNVLDQQDIERSINFLRITISIYQDIALCHAYDIYGNDLNDSLSVYVKKVIPAKRIKNTKKCKYCKNHYKETDVIQEHEDKKYICLNCFNAFAYEKKPDGTWE